MFILGEIVAAITRTNVFNFMVDIVFRDEINDEEWFVSGWWGGVPYYNPPMMIVFKLGNDPSFLYDNLGSPYFL